MASNHPLTNISLNVGVLKKVDVWRCGVLLYIHHRYLKINQYLYKIHIKTIIDCIHCRFGLSSSHYGGHGDNVTM